MPLAVQQGPPINGAAIALMANTGENNAMASSRWPGGVSSITASVAVGREGGLCQGHRHQGRRTKCTPCSDRDERASSTDPTLKPATLTLSQT